MELKLYDEHLTDEGKEKQIRYICITDFLPKVQEIILKVLEFGGSVAYYNVYKVYQAILYK